MTNKNTRRGDTQGNKVMLNSFQHLHLEQPILKEDEILNQVQDDNRRGFTQDYHQINRHSRKLLSGIPTLVKKQGGDPRQNSSGMTVLFDNGLTARGFTLIELLVVVLIIGILAAVAVPQYQKAVIKARLVEIQTLVTAYAKEIEMYRLEHGTYPTSDQWNDIKDSLNVEFSACNFEGSYIWCPSIVIDMYPLGVQNRALLGYSKNFQVGFVKWFADSTYPDRRECLAHINSALANDVCKSFGGPFTREYKYYSHQWNAYELP